MKTTKAVRRNKCHAESKHNLLDILLICKFFTVLACDIVEWTNTITIIDLGTKYILSRVLLYKNSCTKSSRSTCDRCRKTGIFFWPAKWNELTKILNPTIPSLLNTVNQDSTPQMDRDVLFVTRLCFVYIQKTRLQFLSKCSIHRRLKTVKRDINRYLPIRHMVFYLNIVSVLVKKSLSAILRKASSMFSLLTWFINFAFSGKCVCCD